MKHKVADLITIEVVSCHDSGFHFIILDGESPPYKSRTSFTSRQDARRGGLYFASIEWQELDKTHVFTFLHNEVAIGIESIDDGKTWSYFVFLRDQQQHNYRSAISPSIDELKEQALFTIIETIQELKRRAVAGAGVGNAGPAWWENVDKDRPN